VASASYVFLQEIIKKIKTPNSPRRGLSRTFKVGFDFCFLIIVEEGIGISFIFHVILFIKK
jgi:hypothetical protein